jgi:hypothetical protein
MRVARKIEYLLITGLFIQIQAVGCLKYAKLYNFAVILLGIIGGVINILASSRLLHFSPEIREFGLVTALREVYVHVR